MENFNFEDLVAKIDGLKKPGMSNMTEEDLKNMISHIPNQLRDYRGNPRRYYKLESSISDSYELSKEAISILFPEFDLSDPENEKFIVDLFGPTVLSKTELLEDGKYWVRTILF